MAQLEHLLLGPNHNFTAQITAASINLSPTPTQPNHSLTDPQNAAQIPNLTKTKTDLISPNPTAAPPLLEPILYDPLPNNSNQDNNGVIHLDSDEKPIEIEPEEEEEPIEPEPIDLTDQIEEEGEDNYLADEWDNFDNTAYEEYEKENFSPQDPDPPVLSPYHTPSPAGEFDDQLRAIQEEMDQYNLQAQMAAQLEAQEQMDLANLAGEIPIPPQEPEIATEEAGIGSVMAENEPQQTAATENSTTLSRSARIYNRGTPKKYGTKRTWTRKKGMDEAAAKRRTILEAELLEALQDEALSAVPLQQDKVTQVNNYCGM